MQRRHSSRLAGVGAALAVVALLASAPSPARAVALLRDVGAGDHPPTEPLVAAVSLLAWVLAGWLLVIVALTVAAGHGSGIGRAAQAVLRRVAPVAVRRVVELALGLTVAVGASTSPAVAADPSPPSPSPSADPAGISVPALDWPAAARPKEASQAASAAEKRHVVRRGDTLWDLAEQALLDRTGRRPSARQVAQAWPAWWSANRQTIGDDPDLLLPGTPLTPPPPPPTPAS